MKTKRAVAIAFVLLLLSIPMCVFADSVTRMPWVVEYENGDIREGKYTGDIENGIPHGYGLFTSMNSKGITWHYIGMWSNGIMHGEGLQVWETGAQNNGVFRNGEFVSGETIKELVEPSIYDLPYSIAGEQIAIEQLLPGMTYIKTTSGLNYVNVYIDISSYSDKKTAIHDACLYMINIVDILRYHQDVKRVTCKFQYPSIYGGNSHTAISMDCRTSDAVLKDFDSLRTLIETSPLAYMKQLYGYRLSHEFRDFSY